MNKKQQAGGGIQWGRMLKKLNPYTIQKGFRYLKHYGPKEFWIRLHERFEPEEVPYGPWYEAYIPDKAELEKQKKHKFAYTPRISVAVPAFRTPEVFLRQMIQSLLDQTYPNWELCIANGSPDDTEMTAILKEYASADRRICVRDLGENLGIAGNTNAALTMASGEFVGLLDHDDLLAPNALYEIVKKLNEDRELDAVYTDEDKVTTDLSEHFQPHLKPDFNLDLLRSNNYICHFFVVRKTIVDKVGGFRQEFDGAQDHDFIFRCVEEASGRVGHVPEIVYHWRTHKASTADNPASKMYAFDAGKRAIEAHLKRVGVEGEVSHTPDLGFFRVKYPVHGEPMVSIIIPNKDEKESLQACIESIREKTEYQNYEILIIENNSTSEEIFHYYKELSRDPKIRLLRWKKEFNYSAINNYGASFAKGEYLLLLNNDTEIINPDCLEELLGYCMRSDVGAVGARLYYEDDTIQHAGVVIGFGGIAGHCFVMQPRGTTGYCHRIICAQDYSAVTAACMMVKKEAFDKVGGLTEELAVAFNDIDFCMKLRAAGYLIVYNPYAELYHYESKSRGLEDTPEKVARFNKEIQIFEKRWPDILRNGDPYYNPNLTLKSQDFSLRRI